MISHHVEFCHGFMIRFNLVSRMFDINFSKEQALGSLRLVNMKVVAVSFSLLYIIILVNLNSSG